MKPKFIFIAVLIVSVTCVQTTPLLAHLIVDEWQLVSFEKLGFSMLMPSDSYVTTFESQPVDDWVTLRANLQGALLLGLKSEKELATPTRLESMGARLAEIAFESWEILDEGEETAGWKWYRTFRASMMGESIFGVYGTGANGSYILLVKTSEEDLRIHGLAYTKWFESIMLEE